MIHWVASTAETYLAQCGVWEVQDQGPAESVSGEIFFQLADNCLLTVSSYSGGGEN